MKFTVMARSPTGGTTYAVDAENAQEALSKAIAQSSATYPVIEIRAYMDPQATFQQTAMANCLMAMPPVLAESRIGSPMNPYFPHLPL